LDPAFTESVRAYVNDRLGISYAALDFLVIEGQPALIDVNPNGVWNWMDDAIRCDVDAAFLRMIQDFVARAR